MMGARVPGVGPWEGRVGSCDVCVNSVKGPFPSF